MKPKSAVLLVLCAIVPAIISAGHLTGEQTFAPGPAGNAARFFPRDKLMEIGVYYYPEHWPEAEWDRDLANIASLGFSFVHMAEFSWAFLEPKDGRFDFAWLDRGLDPADVCVWTEK